MSTSPTSITITQTNSGWVFSKDVDGKKVTMTVTDKNKNGQLDSCDICKTEGGTFTAAELTHAKKSIFQQNKAETTVGDYLNEQVTAEQEEARAKAFEKAQRAQKRRELEQKTAQINQAKKKNSFWDKVGNAGNAILNSLSALAGFGFGFCGWQYNGGNWNDLNLRCFSSGVQGLQGVSNFMQNQYGNYANINNWGNNQTTPDTNYFSNLINQQNQYLEQQKQQYQNYMSTIQETQQKQQQANKANAVQEYAQKTCTAANEEGAIISDVNKAKINEIYAPSKNPQDYTAEDEAIITHIATYPNIPYDAVDKDNSLENRKLNTQLTTSINNLLNQYHEANTDTAKEKIMSKENFNTLNTLLNKARSGQLTKDDIANIDNIIKNPIKKQS